MLRAASEASEAPEAAPLRRACSAGARRPSAAPRRRIASYDIGTRLPRAHNGLPTKAAGRPLREPQGGARQGCETRGRKRSGAASRANAATTSRAAHSKAPSGSARVASRRARAVARTLCDQRSQHRPPHATAGSTRRKARRTDGHCDGVARSASNFVSKRVKRIASRNASPPGSLPSRRIEVTAMGERGAPWKELPVGEALPVTLLQGAQALLRSRRVTLSSLPFSASPRTLSSQCDIATERNRGDKQRP